MQLTGSCGRGSRQRLHHPGPLRRLRFRATWKIITKWPTRDKGRGGVLGILQTSPRENDREIEKREIRGKNIAAASIGLHTKKESEARNVEQGERRPRLRSRRGVRRHCIDRGLRSLHVDPRLSFFSFFPCLFLFLRFFLRAATVTG